MNLNLSILLDGAAAPQSGGGMSQLIMLVAVMGVFFVFMILPQMRKQKKAKLFASSIKKGNHIITTGGIHGKITSVEETRFIIELEDGSKMKIEKAAVSMEMTNQVYGSEPRDEAAEK